MRRHFSKEAVTITMYSLDRLFGYLVLLAFASGVTIVPGINLYDVFLFFFVLLLVTKNQLKLRERNFFIGLALLVYLPFMLSAYYQVFAGFSVSLYTFYIPYNITILFLYFLFLNRIFSFTPLRPSTVTVCMTTPVLVSLFCWLLPSMQSILSPIYSFQEGYFGRYGGIWGNDSVQLGYYGAVVIFVASFFKMTRQIGLLLYLICALICIVTIMISGTRVGLVGIVLSSFITYLIFGQKMISFSSLVKVGLVLAFIVLIAGKFLVSDFSKVVERFNLFLLYAQISGASEGHIGQMYPKWLGEWAQVQSVWRNLLSYDPSWKFPDSLILFVLANGGLIGSSLLVTFTLLQVKFLIKMPVSALKFFLVQLLIFLAAVSLKGNFVVNNFSMFLFSTLFFSLRAQQEKAEIGAPVPVSD